MSKPGTPRGREDKAWLISFCEVMFIWYAAIHAIAYLPSAIFGSFGEMYGAVSGHVSHAYNNWRDWQYAAVIIVVIIVLYPFMLFFYLLYDGFDPYRDLTSAENKIQGGLTADLCYLFRIILHLYMLLMTVYLFCMLIVMSGLRAWQRFPGQYVWIVKRIPSWPFGSLFFQSGEFFDCAICFGGIWKGSDVVQLTCSCTGNADKCCFHADCLRDQVALHGNSYCVMCEQPLVVANPPPPEEPTE